MKAITNLEKLLSGDESVKPVTRIEQIVKGIDIEPLTHFEQIACGWDLQPMNRLEQIIKGLDVGGYRSREEYFWGEWANHKPPIPTGYFILNISRLNIDKIA